MLKMLDFHSYHLGLWNCKGIDILKATLGFRLMTTNETGKDY